MNIQWFNLPFDVAFDVTSIIALIGLSLLLSASLLRILCYFKINIKWAYTLSAVLFCISFVTISGYSLVTYLRGVFNDLSITSLFLLSYYIFSVANHSSKENDSNRSIFYLIALIGICFYPTALGLGTIDPYSWGFIGNPDHPLSSLVFISSLALLMLFAFIKKHPLLLLCLVSGALAYSLNLLASQNIWDYYIDPLVFVYALYAIGSIEIKKLSSLS